MSHIALETARLRLRPLVLADAEALVKYRRLPEIRRFQSWEPESLDDGLRWIEALGENVPGVEGRWSQWAIEEREGSAMVGDCGCCVRSPQQAEIGITLAPEFQGRGYATEALRGLIPALFEGLDLHRIFASVDPQNRQVVALLDGLGMRREAHHLESYWWRGAWVDDAIFALLRSEWPAQKLAEGLRLEPAVQGEEPWELLLLADPSRAAVERYLGSSETFVAWHGQRCVAVLVLQSRGQELEIMNVAVDEAFEGQGIGKKLLAWAAERGREMGAQCLVVGTGNSSLDALAFYQKSGFRITDIDKGFFSRHYSEAIVEDGIPCVDMLRLRREL